MSKWYLYMVKCCDGSHYTGITTDIKRRLNQHNAKTGAKSLMGKLPVKLVYEETFNNRSEALKREVKIKSFKKSEKLMLILGR